MIVLGIDIGLTGAVAAVDTRGSCQVADMPTVADGKTKRIDGRALILLIRQFVPPGEPALCVIEDVRPRAFGNAGARTNSMHSQGSMMRSRGIVEAVADIARLELKVVRPQTWKRFYGLLGKDKGDGREMATRLYPGAAAQFKRAKDHNRADSVLIAHYGRGRLA